jgi:ribosomal protein L39E
LRENKFITISESSPLWYTMYALSQVSHQSHRGDWRGSGHRGSERTLRRRWRAD